MTGVLTTPGALQALAMVLDDLAAALVANDAGAMLETEPRLAATLTAVRAVVRPQGDDGADVARGVTRVRDAIERCRRLGATVPSLLSIMFPGQVTYGPAGVRVEGLPRHSVLAQRT